MKTSWTRDAGRRTIFGIDASIFETVDEFLITVNKITSTFQLDYLKIVSGDPDERSNAWVPEGLVASRDWTT